MIDEEILTIKNKILESVDNCEKIYLFGSHAYGMPNKDSDYDFFVVLPDTSENPILAIQKVHRNLSKTRMLVPVDILANYKTRFEERSKFPTMERKIVREGILLYERE
jgi:predicted nucleotidyltransferase